MLMEPEPQQPQRDAKTCVMAQESTWEALQKQGGWDKAPAAHLCNKIILQTLPRCKDSLSVVASFFPKRVGKHGNIV